MCTYLSVTDAATVAAAQAHLESLLNPTPTPTSSSSSSSSSSHLTHALIDDTGAALRALRDRMQAVRAAQHRARAQSRTRRATLTALERHQSSLDQHLIDTRVRRGHILMDSDALARDVARSKRLLSSDDDRDRDRVRDRSHAIDNIQREDNSTQTDHDMHRLQAVLDEEHARLQVAQIELLAVADEMALTRKKRSDLTAKMKHAREQW